LKGFDLLLGFHSLALYLLTIYNLCFRITDF